MENDIQIEYVDITPHKSILPKIGRAGYSVAQAVAELIDNAIDAKLESEKLSINVIIKDDLIEVKDTGTGMNKEELTKAFSLAHSTKKDKLGEFGLGLKTSCQCLGENFSILTSRKEDKKYFQMEYNEESWINNEEHTWNRYPINILKKDNNGEHGTTISIKKLKVRVSYAIDQVKKDIGTRFAPFLNRNEIEVKVNKFLIKPYSPELVKETKKEFEIKLNNNKIYGWYALMKESSQKGFYGFNIFRRGRMITCYDKIGLKEHATIARITGEINLDHVPVTHNKREFIKDSDEYIIAEEALSKEFKNIIKEARKKAKDDKITDHVKQEVDIWKDKIAESLKTDELNNLLPNLKEKKSVNEGDKEEDIDIEKRDEWKLNTPEIKLSNEQKVNSKERNPKKFHKKRHLITIRGKRFNFNIEFAHLDSNSSWKKWSADKSSIEIIINTDFPAWWTTKDTPFYVVMLVGEALGEIICKEAGEFNVEKIQEIKEEILRKSSELKNEFEEEVEDKKDEFREATSFIS